jgi:hypothetical protein
LHHNQNQSIPLASTFGLVDLIVCFSYKLWL